MTGWTADQKMAIEETGGSLLVAAAAGSGKTAVLVERIIRLIVSGKADINSMLVVTFTNAAANEMRERIGDALDRKLEEEPGNLRLRRQKMLLGNASVTTLHSFCLDLIRENFFRLDVDPGSRVADEHEARVIIRNELDRLFEDVYGDIKAWPGFDDLAEAFGAGRDDRVFKEKVLELYTFSQSHPDPGRWLADVSGGCRSFDWAAAAGKEILENLDYIIENLCQALNLANRPDGPGVYAEPLAEEIDFFVNVKEKAAAAADYAELASVLGKTGFVSRLPSVRKDSGCTEGLKDMAGELRAAAKKRAESLKSRYAGRSNPDDYLRETEMLCRRVEVLCRLAGKLETRFAVAKRAKKLLDFNDFEHFALKLLRDESGGPSPEAEKLRGKYSYVLVDEYQDINEVQETVIRMVSGEDNLFMVGDVKQSIYRFRLAEPALFQHKNLTFPLLSEKKDVSGSKVVLSSNFRSRTEVLDAVNYLFGRIMTRDYFEIDYDREAELVGGFPYEDCPGLAGGIPELFVLEKEPSEDMDREERDSLEAERIADIIQETVSRGKLVYDKETGEYRKIRYRDIVILHPSPRTQSEVYGEVFGRRNIPFFSQTEGGYFESVEIRLVLSLLKIIDNPLQDISLAGVLRSPLFGFSEEELVKIRLAGGRDADFYRCLKAVSAEADVLGKKIRHFFGCLGKWQDPSSRESISVLIWEIFRDTGYYEFAGSLPGGEKRQANLRSLHDRAKEYEQTSLKGLYGFLGFIEEIREKSGDLEAARTVSENSDAVRFMSIHKSKGLEFPVVFCAGLGKKFNMQDVYGDMLLHKKLGVGLKFFDAERRVRYPSLPHNVIAGTIKREAMAENMRVLYVAMTRAREKLYLFGSVRSLPKQADKWILSSGQAKEISGALLMSGQNYLDWIVPAYAAHRKVVFEGEEFSSVSLAVGPGTGAVKAGFICASGDSMASCVKTETVSREDAEESPGNYRKLERRLGWTYPHSAASGLKGKMSVTEIKDIFFHRKEGEESGEHPVSFRRKVLLEEKGRASGSRRGSLIHLILQTIPLDSEVDSRIIGEHVEKLREAGQILEGEITGDDLREVEEFFRTETGRKINSADKVYREAHFTMNMDAERIHGDAGRSEKILVQGAVDIFWMEDGEVTVLDYKTDRLTGPELKERYGEQLCIYGEALEKALALPVSRRLIYSFHEKRVIEI